MSVKYSKRQSGIEGSGIFADEDILEEESVMQLSGKKVSAEEIDELLEAGKLRFDDPFQVGEEEYLVLDPLPLSVNHSCDPNAGVRGENKLVALRTITAGEEITYDYSTVVGDNNSEWHMACNCGASTCRKVIGSWKILSSTQLAFYHKRNALPDFILKQSGLDGLSPGV